MPRTLYLVAYDVCNPRRLARVTRYFQAYRVAGQKSVPEIWVTPAELQHIRADMDQLIDPTADPRMKPRCIGQAQSFQPGPFCVT